MSAANPAAVPQRSGWSGLRISGVLLSVLAIIVGHWGAGEMTQVP